MNRLSFPVAALAAALSLSACGDILHDADFEADRVGERPSMSPAGPPTGDMIRVVAEEGNAVVVDGGITGKSLLYRYNPTLSQVDFIGRETGTEIDTYWALWNGRAEGFSAATPRMAFSVGNFSAGIADLEIEDGRFRASDEVIGEVVQGEVHTVIVRVDNAAGSYRATIFQRGATLSSGDQRLIHRGRVPGDRVFDIAMFYDAEPSVSDPAAYLIDNILITGREPEAEMM